MIPATSAMARVSSQCVCEPVIAPSCLVVSGNWPESLEVKETLHKLNVVLPLFYVQEFSECRFFFTVCS